MPTIMPRYFPLSPKSICKAIKYIGLDSIVSWLEFQAEAVYSAEKPLKNELSVTNYWNKPGDLLRLFAILLAFFALGLGVRPYITPSEARYIEIPRQMLETGDWLTPRINGVPYFEKPPLFYWLQASVMQIGGLAEFSGRMATTLAVIGNCLLTFLIAGRLYGRRAAWLSALVLSTCLLGYGLSRIALLDQTVTLFITLTLGSFLAAQKNGDAKKRRCFYHLMYIAAALAMLTKGLIGVVIPGLVIGMWLMITRSWQVLLRAQRITGSLLFLAIAVPWHVLMQQAHPEFFDFYFIHEHFTRYLTDEHKRTAPWCFFIAVTIVGLVPWVFLLPSAARCFLRERNNRDTLLLLLWVLLPLIFFSASKSKLAPYIYVIFPPLAVMFGRMLAERWKHGYWRKIIICMALITCALEVAANFVVPHYDKRTIKPLIASIGEIKPDDEVVAYNSYWQDLPIYLNRNITVVSWQGELHFGVEHNPSVRQWMIEPEEFVSRCARAQQGFYVFMKQEDYKDLYSSECSLKLLGSYGKTVLLAKTRGTD